MALFDSLCDAYRFIEEGEEYRNCCGEDEGEKWCRGGYPCDDLRKIKVEIARLANAIKNMS